MFRSEQSQRVSEQKEMVKMMLRTVNKLGMCWQLGQGLRLLVCSGTNMLAAGGDVKGGPVKVIQGMLENRGKFKPSKTSTVENGRVF